MDGEWGKVDMCKTALKFNLTNECVRSICSFYVGSVCLFLWVIKAPVIILMVNNKCPREFNECEQCSHGRHPRHTSPTELLRNENIERTCNTWRMNNNYHYSRLPTEYGYFWRDQWGMSNIILMAAIEFSNFKSFSLWIEIAFTRKCVCLFFEEGEGH